MKIISATNPKFADQSGNRIELTVTFEGIGTVPFLAFVNDVEAHGRELFSRALAGEFGPVAPLDLTVVKTQKLAALDANRKRIETLPITGNQGGKLFNISRPEKINEFLMGGLSIALDPSPAASFTMLDDNGVEVTYSKTLMGQIISFINSTKQPALARYNARKQAIEDAQDAADLALVDTDLTKP